MPKLFRAFIVALVSAFAGGLYVLLLALIRQNGRLLLRMEALEQSQRNLQGAAHALGQPSFQAFAVAHPTLRLRRGTNDLEIVHEIVSSNSYRLPATFDADDVVVDIGAHIGIFALAVLDRGCGEVHCYEPEPGNARSARNLLQQYGDRASVTEAAVWRSDFRAAGLPFRPCEADPGNRGGGDVLHAEGYGVSALALDDVLLDVSHGGERRIRLLKLDCEGSEYPILLTSRLLHFVDEIAGEYHAVPAETAAFHDGLRFDIAAIHEHLERSGFDVAVTHDDSGSNAQGMFFARRRAEGAGTPEQASLT